MKDKILEVISSKIFMLGVISTIFVLQLIITILVVLIPDLGSVFDHSIGVFAFGFINFAYWYDCLQEN